MLCMSPNFNQEVCESPSALQGDCALLAIQCGWRG
jgi:hypothetical protein